MLGEVEQPGRMTLVEGSTLKGLLEIAKPKPNAYIDHADYAYVLRDGDEIHIPANLQKTRGRILLSDDTLMRIRVRSVSNPVILLGDKNTEKLKININRAPLEALQDLPRIGPETARRIIVERETHGPFRKKEDLLRVKGIGRKTYKWLEPLISVE